MMHVDGGAEYTMHRGYTGRRLTVCGLIVKPGETRTEGEITRLGWTVTVRCGECRALTHGHEFGDDPLNASLNCMSCGTPWDRRGEVGCPIVWRPEEAQ